MMIWPARIVETPDASHVYGLLNNVAGLKTVHVLYKGTLLGRLISSSRTQHQNGTDWLGHLSSLSGGAVQKTRRKEIERLART